MHQLVRYKRVQSAYLRHELVIRPKLPNNPRRKPIAILSLSSHSRFDSKNIQTGHTSDRFEVQTLPFIS